MIVIHINVGQLRNQTDEWVLKIVRLHSGVRANDYAIVTAIEQGVSLTGYSNGCDTNDGKLLARLQ